MIRNIAFDLGGVVLALSYEQAVRRFEEIGLRDARRHLDAFEQKGIFGALESWHLYPKWTKNSEEVASYRNRKFFLVT